MSAPKIIDRAILRQRRMRAASTWQEADFLLNWSLDDLDERMANLSRSFETALVIGAPSGMGRERLEKSGKVDTIIEADIGFDGGLASGVSLALDEERLPIAEASLDLIISVLNLQFINDLPGALIQMRRALKPDGLFMASMIGGESLSALRSAFLSAEAELYGGATPRVIPFADVRDMGGLLQRAGFALPVTDVDRVEVRYRQPARLFEDLRLMGAQNPLHARSRGLMHPRLLARALSELETYKDDEGKLSVSFDIISLSGWAPHESQQKPLKPGSAKTSLKTVLEKKQKI